MHEYDMELDSLGMYNPSIHHLSKIPGYSKPTFPTKHLASTVTNPKGFPYTATAKCIGKALVLKKFSANRFGNCGRSEP